MHDANSGKRVRMMRGLVIVAAVAVVVVAGGAALLALRDRFDGDGGASQVATKSMRSSNWQDRDCDDAPEHPLTCGWLIPWRQDSTREIALPVDIVRHDPARASGIASIYVMGGPGGTISGGAESAEYWHGWRESLGLDHDLVLYEQRGGAMGWPDIRCPAYVDVMLERLREPADGLAAMQADWQAFERVLLDCAAAVPENERRHGLYSTATHREDLVALMRALRKRHGYRRFVLYGASYGSRLALETAKAAPDGLVERVVLDAFYPVGTDLNARSPITLDETLADFDTWCADEADCAHAGGAIGERLRVATDRLAEAPRRHTVDLLEWDPDTPTIDVHVDASMFLGYVMSEVAYGENLASLPSTIDAIATGAWPDDAVRMAQDATFMALDTGFSPLVYYLVECRDNAELDPAAYAAALAAAPRFADRMPYLPHGEGFCERLGVSPEPLQVEASEIDALVTSMQIEPITPWRVARASLGQLRNAEWRLVRGGGHIVADHDACGAKAIGAYMNSGALDAWNACDLVESARFVRGHER